MTLQAVKGQLDRDAQIMNLVNVMEDTYSFVGAVDIREKIKIFEDTVMSILQQTVECVVFIREYSGRGFGGDHSSCLSCCRHSHGIQDDFLRRLYPTDPK